MPIAWTWVPYAKGHSLTPTQVALLARVRARLPPREAVERLRMWTEEMIANLKGNDIDLEATHLRDLDKLNRLTLTVCLLCVLLIALGVEHTKLGR